MEASYAGFPPPSLRAQPPLEPWPPRRLAPPPTPPSSPKPPWRRPPSAPLPPAPLACSAPSPLGDWHRRPRGRRSQTLPPLQLRRRQWSAQEKAEPCLISQGKGLEEYQPKRKKKGVRELTLTPKPPAAASPPCGSRLPTRPPRPAWSPPQYPWASSADFPRGLSRPGVCARHHEQLARQMSPRLDGRTPACGTE